MLRAKETHNRAKKLSLPACLSLTLMFIMVNVLITTLVFRHEHNIKFPPLIHASPCAMPQDILDKFNFTSTKKPYTDNHSGVEATSCKYYREGYTFSHQLTSDEVILTRMKEPHLVPTYFKYPNPRNPQSFIDRAIQNNREIREICESDTQCLVYIEPNIVMRLIYRTGALCQQDAMLLSLYYTQEQPEQALEEF